jgi:hypothetical protein
MFILLNNNKTINTQYTSYDLDQILRFYLSVIKYEFNLIKMHQSANFNPVNIDLSHLKIVEVDEYILDFIINTYSLDVNKLSIMKTHNGKCYTLEINDEIQYEINDICKVTQLVQPVCKPKRLSDMINNTTNNNNVRTTRIIPTVNNNEESSISDISSVCIQSDVSSVECDVDDDELQEFYQTMVRESKEQDEKIKFLKEELEEDEENYADYRYELNSKLNDIKYDKEKQEDMKSRFESEKNFTYVNIRNDVESGKLLIENIPSMFAKQYPVYKFMDNRDLLNDDHAYDIYQDLYKSMYDEDSDTDDNDNIENMLDIVNNKKFESSDKILKKLDIMESMIDDSENSVSSDLLSENSVSSSESTEIMLNEISVYSTDSEEDHVFTT